MSHKTVYNCDFCKKACLKVTVKIEGLFIIKDESSNAPPAYRELPRGDFCSIACLNSYIELKTKELNT